MDYAARRIFGPHICGDAIDVDINNTLLTGSWRSEEQLQLWDFGSGKLIEVSEVGSSSTHHSNLISLCNRISTFLIQVVNIH